MNSTRTRRQTISDSMITDEVFEKLIEKFIMSRENITDIKQKDVIEFSLPLKLGNETIARLVNSLVDNANATAGSINQAIRAMTRSRTYSQKMLDELMEKLEGGD